MNFRSLYRHGFARVAACTIPSALADPVTNAQSILRVAAECSKRGVAVAVFPELALSAYSIDDLRLQDALLDAVEQAAATLIEASADLMPLLIVGAPLRHHGRVYNTALAIHRGRLLGVVPKAYLPNYREFYEPRQFAAGVGWRGATVTVAGRPAPFGLDLLFVADDIRDLIVHIEICEDFWIPVPPVRWRRWQARASWSTCPAVRSPSARRTPGGYCVSRNRCAAWLHICTPRPGRAN